MILKDVKTLQQDQWSKASVKVTCVRKEPIKSYGQDKKLVQHIFLPDSSAYKKALVYDVAIMAQILEEQTYIISNFISKEK